MENIFLKVLNMSITSSYVILIIMLIRLNLKKAPKKYSYAMWAVLAFRAVFPVSFKSALSIFNLGFFENAAVQNYPRPVVNYALGAGDFSQIPKMPMGSPAENAVKSVAPLKISAINTANPLQILTFSLAVIWLLGIAALLIYGVISYFTLYKRLKDAIRIEKNVYKSDKVTTPFVLGIFLPKIYLPFGLEKDDEEYALLHERYHIKRCDHIVKPLAFLILSLHWFNPLFWIAFKLMNNDMEMSCDEFVIAGKENIKKNYSTLLVSFAANKRFPRPCPLAFGENGIKTRVKNILSWKKPKTWISVIAGVLVLSVIVACAANPKMSSNNNNIFGKTYRVEKSIYMNPLLSSMPPDKENSPIFELTDDEEFEIQEGSENDRQDWGKAELSQKRPDFTKCADVGYADGYSAEKLKKSVTRVWSVSHELSDIYWIFEDKSGKLYIAYENSAMKDFSIAWIGELSEYSIENIYEAKTPYIGNVSAVGNIIGLTLPVGFSRGSDGLMALNTDAEPYTITINYTAEEEKFYTEKRALANQAIMLFALIDNLGEVQYHVELNDEEYTTRFFTRSEADALFDKSIAEYAKNSEGFSKLYNLVYFADSGKYVENAAEIFSENQE